MLPMGVSKARINMWSNRDRTVKVRCLCRLHQMLDQRLRLVLIKSQRSKIAITDKCIRRKHSNQVMGSKVIDRSKTRPNTPMQKSLLRLVMYSNRRKYSLLHLRQLQSSLLGRRIPSPLRQACKHLELSRYLKAVKRCPKIILIPNELTVFLNCPRVSLYFLILF